MEKDLKTCDLTKMNSVNDEELLTAILPKKIYIISAHGWYYKFNYYSIHTTFEEALDALGFSSKEKYEEYINSSWDKEGFWGYHIDEINTTDLFNKVKENIQSETCWNETNEIVKRSQNIIDYRVETKIKELRIDMEKYMKEWVKTHC